MQQFYKNILSSSFCELISSQNCEATKLQVFQKAWEQKRKKKKKKIETAVLENN
jgi:hypothetical protein